MEELKSQCESSGLTGAALAGWFKLGIAIIKIKAWVPPGNTSGLLVTTGTAYQGTTSAVVVIGVRNLPGQVPWAVGQARIISAAGTPIAVLSVQLKPRHLAPGEEGLVALDAKIPDWKPGEVFSVELVDTSGERRLSFNLSRK